MDDECVRSMGKIVRGLEMSMDCPIRVSKPPTSFPQIRNLTISFPLSVFHLDEPNSYDVLPSFLLPLLHLHLNSLAFKLCGPLISDFSIVEIFRMLDDFDILLGYQGSIICGSPPHIHEKHTIRLGQFPMKPLPVHHLVFDIEIKSVVD